MMVIECAFSLGEIVYLKMDKDQNKRMVLGISIRPNGVLYDLSNVPGNSSWHYEMEIAVEKDVLITTTG